jgi:hypothetical protein
MPVNEEKDREAMQIGDMIHSAAGLVENAIRIEDETSKKALRDAAKALLQTAVAKLDESVGASEEDDE